MKILKKASRMFEAVMAATAFAESGEFDTAVKMANEGLGKSKREEKRGEEYPSGLTVGTARGGK